MKKVFCFTISLMIILLSAFTVCASKTDIESIYYLEELGITIYTPLYDAVATRDVNKMDITQEEYEEMIDFFEKENLHFFGYSSLFSASSQWYYDYYTELYIYGYDSSTLSLSSYSDAFLEKNIDQFNSDWEDAGLTVVKSEIYESYDTKYILSHIKDTEGNYAINYHTIENYKSIDIILWSYNGEPSSNAKTDLVSIINSIEFDEQADVQIYEKTFTLNIAENGKLTPLGESLILTGVIVLIQIIAGVVVLVALLSKRKKRRKAALAQTDITTQPISGSPVQPALKTKFCIYCGTKLTENDSFCHVCGKNQKVTDNAEVTENSN